MSDNENTTDSIQGIVSQELMETLLKKLLPYTDTGYNQLLERMKENNLMITVKMSKEKDKALLYMIDESELNSFSVNQNGIIKAVDLEQVKTLLKDEQFERLAEVFGGIGNNEK